MPATGKEMSSVKVSYPLKALLFGPGVSQALLEMSSVVNIRT